MSDSQLNLALTGVTGRMGKSLVKAISMDERVRLSLAIQHGKSELLNQDAGQVSGVETQNVPIKAELIKPNFDVLIDFTLVEPCLQHLEFCVQNGKPIVIGTTGFSNEQKRQITQASTHIPIVFAPNMSVGVNLSFHLLDKIARVIGAESDIEIVEAHHRNKLDAPSGTAVRMGEVIANALERKLDDCAIYCREGITEIRSSETIGFSTIRAGDVVGDHTVIFANQGERLELAHKASSRLTFAKGAIRAAIWLQNQPAALYDMQDVLGLK